MSERPSPKIVVRPFIDEEGNHWNEVIGIYGYSPNIRIGDKWIRCTKQEHDELIGASESRHKKEVRV